MPADEATYTFRTNADCSFRRLSTEESSSLPLLAVRFAPNLDDHNGAETPGRVDTPKLEVSYDDGRTWKQVRLDRAYALK